MINLCQSPRVPPNALIHPLPSPSPPHPPACQMSVTMSCKARCCCVNDYKGNTLCTAEISTSISHDQRVVVCRWQGNLCQWCWAARCEARQQNHCITPSQQHAHLPRSVPPNAFLLHPHFLTSFVLRSWLMCCMKLACTPKQAQ